MMTEHKCFRCGEIVEKEDDGTLVRCFSCGELSILSFTTACDIINDLYLSGKFDKKEYEELDD